MCLYNKIYIRGKNTKHKNIQGKIPLAEEMAISAQVSIPPPSWNKTPDFAFQEAKEPKEVKMSQRQEENTGNRLLEKFIPMCAGYLEHHSVQL